MPDAHVRLASVADAPELARIQRDTWRFAYSELLGESVLAELASSDDALVEPVRQAVIDPDTTVHLATEGRWAVGWCVAGPAPVDETSPDDNAEDAASTGLLGTLLVEPRWGRRGHGGRLLAAAVDALATGGITRCVAWVPEPDEASLSFFVAHDWQPDGTVRTLRAEANGRGVVRELRLAAELND